MVSSQVLETMYGKDGAMSDPQKLKPRGDFLKVQGHFKNYLPDNGFSYTTVTESQFGQITAEDLLQYRMILLEPDWVDYTALRNGITQIALALEQSSCLVVALRIGNENLGSQADIDLLGTDYDDTFWHDSETIINSSHPFASAVPWGGINLVNTDFNSWSVTDVGYFANLPSTQTGYTEILQNKDGASSHISMFEYSYGKGHVIVDTLSSLNGGWGFGDIFVANNYVLYMNYTSYLNQVPIVFDSSANTTYNEFTTGNLLSWDVRDSDPNNYGIFIDGLLKQNGVWTSGTPITIDIDGLAKGTYNYEIVVSDLQGHSSSNSIYVTVIDGTAPVFVTIPADVSYALNSVDNDLEWVVIDDEAENVFFILVDDVLVDFGPWINNEIIAYNVDDLLVGIHNVTIVVSDWADNFNFHNVVVTIINDTSNPSFVSSSGNIQYEEGDGGNVLRWRVSDTFPDNYQLYLNDSLIDIGNWEDNVQLQFNVDGLSLGIYNFTIIFDDTSGLELVDSLWVRVIDTTAPLITGASANFSYESGSTGNVIWLSATDNNPNNFVLLANGTGYFTAGWLSGEILAVNIDGLDLGYYNFTILMFDTSSNVAINSVFVLVEDTINPTINQPTDYTYEENSISNNIDWTVDDENPSTYIVYNNGSEFSSGFWSASSIFRLNINGLELGVHNFTIIIYDVVNNFAIDMVWITVVDTIDPGLDAPPDILYEYDDLQNQIIWTATDTNPDLYEVYRNGSTINSGGWISGAPIIIEVDLLGVGTYNFTIVVNDTSNNFVINTVWVTIQDTTNPTINNHIDIEYEKDSTSNQIVWIANDGNAAIYIVYLDGNLYESSSWISGVQISVNVDNLGLGNYNFTIVVSDIASNIVTDTVFVTVNDVTDPTVDSPSDISYENGMGNPSIVWTPTDNNTDIYIIYKDGISLDTNTWVSGSPITINVGGFETGIYNFTIVLNDTSDNQISDTVLVIVVDTTNP
ncbi:MAG: hypothetical protein IH840_16160, partial [Candidatus Heimdallarchaeota archaeon]|nr:hypothetical protein [Candidatus Heimdallarchaeota archaeon]